jgi:hypothetical protein
VFSEIHRESDAGSNFLQVPEHLREDFCGTALVAATWCRRDVRRTATGVDNDPLVLQWGMARNVLAHDLAQRVCLLENDVLLPDARAKLVEAKCPPDVPFDPPSSDKLHHQIQVDRIPTPSDQPSSSCQTRSDQPDDSSYCSLVASEGEAANQTSAESTSEMSGCAPAAEEGRISQEASSPVPPREAQPDSPQDLVGALQRGDTSGSCLPQAPDFSSSHEMHGVPCSSASKREDAASCVSTHSGSALEQLEGADAELGPPEGELQRLRLLATKPCDIVCALNYCICLLHSASDLSLYLRKVRSGFGSKGGIFVADLLGGSGAEASVNVIRKNQVTGAEYQWEQVGFDPVTRLVHAYLSLRHRQSRRTARRAFHYHWRLWTIPEIKALLLSAGFSDVKVWLRALEVEGISSPTEESASTSLASSGYLEYSVGRDMQIYEPGWSAYIIGIASSHSP